MKVRYDNEQDDTDPMNGVVITDCGKLSEITQQAAKQSAFVHPFVGEASR